MNRIRIEDPDYASLVTTRTLNSRLWFVNNPELHRNILGSLAKYQHTRCVHLYAFVIQGDHYHGVATFPLGNRADFQRDLNSSIQRHVKNANIGFEGGALWHRRYSGEFLAANQDVENYFFYCALQTVHAGLCEDPRDYNGYNSFWDAIEGRVCSYEVFDRAKYNDARRYKKNVRREDYITVHELIFDRLPGYEKLSQEDYKTLMLIEYEARRQKIIAQRLALGLGFLGKKKLARTVPGSYPRSTKKSRRNSVRPIVLTTDSEIRKQFSERYFYVRDVYRKASRDLRLGKPDVAFPRYTYLRGLTLSNAFPMRVVTH